MVDRVRFTMRTVILLVVIEHGLRTSSLPDLCARLGIRLDDADPTFRVPREPATWWGISSVARRALRVTRWWPFGDTCLRQCLVVGALIKDAAPVLVIGMRRENGAAQAHAWLSVAGHALDPNASRYSTFTLR